MITGVILGPAFLVGVSRAVGLPPGAPEVPTGSDHGGSVLTDRHR